MATIVATTEKLVHKILLRLPVKSLLRFKCVSKQWLALISEPKFCHSHTLRLYRTSRVFPSAILLAPVGPPTSQVIPLITNNGSDSVKSHNVEVPIGMVIQSCNGLLLIEGINPEDLSEVDEYFVCNPTTNKSVPVIFPTQQFSSSVITLFICFEPLKSPYYKLVSIRLQNYKSFSDMGNTVISTNSIHGDVVINVYSSETSSWSEPGFSFTSLDGIPPHYNNAVYFNGSLYWHVSVLRKFCFLDLDSQIFKTCPMPLNIEENGVSKFCESAGHLYFVFETRVDSVLKIMELNEENSEWSLRFHIKLCESSFQILLSFPYCVVKKENEEESMLLIFDNEKVMFYNLVDATFTDLSSSSPSLMIETCSVVYQHYDNLSCVYPIEKIGR
ncbi:putative F-box domain-containing protein [Lupinus albus]|uniref:Putative F-box domain-containing protein n=1 Tax=Lupinus albus TaxID=3870 RepID=A0A6A4R283_LUPAL|nr:putative F-box domain-containing protein [Lupinus albus]